MSELIHLRAFPADLSYRDGVLVGRFVPYNVTATVLDELPDGTLDIYDEGFRPRAFSRQASSSEAGVIRRISLVHAHEGGLGFLGPAQAMRDAPDGLYGEIAVLRSRRDDVADLLKAGIEELSIEYREVYNGTELSADGVRWRTAAHLDRVALEAQSAYTGARVLAYRAEVDELAAAEAARAAEAEAERVAAETAAEAERAAAEAAEARRREQAELDAWLAAETERQRQFEATYTPR